MFSTIELAISLDDELAALLADYAAFTGDDSGTAVDVPVVDPGVVVDPMASGDTVVFTGETAPVDPDVDTVTDPAVVTMDDPAPTDVTIDLPALEGLFQVDDGGFDLDLTILEVGRAFGLSGFTDLP